MRLFIARHGQVCPVGQGDSAFDTSRDDPLLTDLGLKQAELLGEEMRRVHFSGRIIASPFSRTVMTAAQAAKVCDLSISLDPRFREIVQREEGLAGFEGKTLAQLKALFPQIRQDSLPYPWWTVPKNTMEEVVARVRLLIEDVIKGQEDCLLVGHGASTIAAAIVLLGLNVTPEREVPYANKNMNCSLSEYQITPSGVTPVRLFDIAHLPDHMITSNLRPVIEREGKKCFDM